MLLILSISLFLYFIMLCKIKIFQRTDRLSDKQFSSLVWSSILKWIQEGWQLAMWYRHLHRAKKGEKGQEIEWKSREVKTNSSQSAFSTWFTILRLLIWRLGFVSITVSYSSRISSCQLLHHILGISWTLLASGRSHRLSANTEVKLTLPHHFWGSFQRSAKITMVTEDRIRVI